MKGSVPDFHHFHLLRPVNGKEKMSIDVPVLIQFAGMKRTATAVAIEPLKVRSDPMDKTAPYFIP